MVGLYGWTEMVFKKLFLPKGEMYFQVVWNINLCEDRIAKITEVLIKGIYLGATVPLSWYMLLSVS